MRPANADFDIEKLLSYMLRVTNFPPLVYAMRVLREQSFLSIPGWVSQIIALTNLFFTKKIIQTALIEGMFALFKTVISTFITGISYYYY